MNPSFIHATQPKHFFPPVPAQIPTAKRVARFGNRTTLPEDKPSHQPQAYSGFWNKLRNNSLVALAIYIAGIITGRQTYTPPAPHVVSVHDGDTFMMSNGDHIRIFGADAPELGQPLAEESKKRLESLILGSSPHLKQRSSSYERKVCEVQVGHTDISETLIREGLAYRDPAHARNQYQAAEADARNHQRGVWKVKNGGQRPWDWRDQHKKKSNTSK